MAGGSAGDIICEIKAIDALSQIKGGGKGGKGVKFGKDGASDEPVVLKVSSYSSPRDPLRPPALC